MDTSSVIAALVLCLATPALVVAQAPGDAASGGSAPIDSPAADSGAAAGAAGTSTGAFDLPRGGMVAIIIVAVLVGVGGIASAALFYVAKKRQWEIRKTLRRSARRLTSRSQRNLNRQTGVPPTPRTPMPAMKKNRTNTADLEKGAFVVETTKDKARVHRTTATTRFSGHPPS